MDEELAGQEPDDFVGGNTAIGTADPQVVGVLLRREALEEVGTLGDPPLGPRAVVLKEVVE